MSYVPVYWERGKMEHMLESSASLSHRRNTLASSEAAKDSNMDHHWLQGMNGGLYLPGLKYKSLYFHKPRILPLSHLKLFRHSGSVKSQHLSDLGFLGLTSSLRVL